MAFMFWSALIIQDLILTLQLHNANFKLGLFPRFTQSTVFVSSRFIRSKSMSNAYPLDQHSKQTNNFLVMRHNLICYFQLHHLCCIRVFIGCISTFPQQRRTWLLSFTNFYNVRLEPVLEKGLDNNAFGHLLVSDK